MAIEPQQDSSPIQFFFTLIGALLALIVISLVLIQLLNGVKTYTPAADQATDASAVAERIKPVAQVEVSKASAPGSAISGEAIVNNACIACHGTGAMGAPKIGDKGAWGPRIAKGYKALISNAIKGIRMMPPRGGNPDLSDDELAHAVAFMANASGAKFTPPKSAAK
jgi:cytochrome c5